MREIILQIPEGLPEVEVEKIRGFFQRYLDSAASDIAEEAKQKPITPEAA